MKPPPTKKSLDSHFARAKWQECSDREAPARSLWDTREGGRQREGVVRQNFRKPRGKIPGLPGKAGGEEVTDGKRRWRRCI